MLASWCLILYSMMILECWRRCCSVGRSMLEHGCDAGMSSVVMHRCVWLSGVNCIISSLCMLVATTVRLQQCGLRH